jgi:ATP-dependent Lhr-like helicase
VIPTQRTLVLERFFDESGGMQLVLHAPFGSRINKAWGLALRKRFCRQFNFELQAAATEDAVLLSLGPQHSFPLSDVFRYLHPETTRDVLVQAFLDAPVFPTRWRWNTTVSLAVPRSRGGRKVAPQLQRMLADDLMAAVFPDAAACLENIPGDRAIPDHPLVKQTVHDCLQEAMDFDGLRAVLERIHRGELALVARDTPEPSLFAHEILNAKPYAFLDDAPLEERRAQAVQSRRATQPSRAGDLGALDAAAIARVRDEERPDPRDADEMHDALLTAGFLTTAELSPSMSAHLQDLTAARRAGRVWLPGRNSRSAGLQPCSPRDAPAWIVAAERLPEMLAVHPQAAIEDGLAAPSSRAERTWTRLDALVEILRGRLAMNGPTTARALAEPLCVPLSEVEAALLALESEGVILRGQFSPRSPHGEMEWADRALLARIHRYTLNRLRAEIEPVSPSDFMRFLFRWQHVDPATQLNGLDGLREIAAMLDGFEAAAGAWERSVLPARLKGYEPGMLDMLCLAGEVGWARLSPAVDAAGTQLAGSTPIALFLREHAELWRVLRARPEHDVPLPPPAQCVLDALRGRGPSFFNDLGAGCGLDADALRSAIGALVAAGLVASDGFAGLRALIRRSHAPGPVFDRRATFAGRWSVLRSAASAAPSPEAGLELQAWTLLRRYGIVFRRLLTREANAAPWRDLTRIYRRLEARGEIRGGRFVTGASGEQFALPDAVERLREVRRTPADGRLLVVSAVDPLNLSGIVTSGERVRAARRSRMVYRDGVPIAVREGEAVRQLTALDGAAAVEVSRVLNRRQLLLR